MEALAGEAVKPEAGPARVCGTAAVIREHCHVNMDMWRGSQVTRRGGGRPAEVVAEARYGVGL